MSDQPDYSNPSLESCIGKAAADRQREMNEEAERKGCKIVDLTRAQDNGEKK